MTHRGIPETEGGDRKRGGVGERDQSVTIELESFHLEMIMVKRVLKVPQIVWRGSGRKRRRRGNPP
uniref:Uncharacterized protein n=1 Tax=Anguilla anguilla TaxID=7936 RepID=A0A0E9VZC4_ANGAN